MERPLQVYLDSSDFSDFGRVLGGKGKPADAAVLQSLRALSESGAVEYRFSSIHVLEAAPVQIEDLADAKRAAEAMKLLCGPHALEPWHNLPVIELSAHLLGDTILPPRNRTRFHGRNDNGYWFPSFEKTMMECRQELTAGFGDPLAIVQSQEPELVANRAMRRKANREAKAGRAKKAMTDDMRQNWPFIADRLRQIFPVSSHSERAWRRLILGNGSPLETARAVQDELSNLTAVMDWMAPSVGPMSSLPMWLRSASDKFVEMYKSIRASVEGQRAQTEPVVGKAKLESIWKKSSLGRGEIAQRGMIENVKGLLQDEELEIQRLGFTLEAAKTALDVEGVAILPSQVALNAIIGSNMRKNASPFEQRRNLENVASDVGDVLHAVYIPYVDLMRVDKFSENYLRPIARDYSTVVVKRRSELMDAINTALQQRV
jgi:hypothetical protein